MRSRQRERARKANDDARNINACKTHACRLQAAGTRQSRPTRSAKPLLLRPCISGRLWTFLGRVRISYKKITTTKIKIQLCLTGDAMIVFNNAAVFMIQVFIRICMGTAVE